MADVSEPDRIIFILERDHTYAHALQFFQFVLRIALCSLFEKALNHLRIQSSLGQIILVCFPGRLYVLLEVVQQQLKAHWPNACDAAERHPVGQLIQ